MPHTEFQIEQLLKHKPNRIANKLLTIYGDNAVDVVKRHLPESMQKEVFITNLINYKGVKERRKWNRGYV